MPYREKIAWISLFTTSVIWGQYFWRLAEQLRRGAGGPGDYLGMFIGTVIVAVVVQVVLTVAVAIAKPSEAEVAADERERMIELKSSSAAYGLLSLLVVLTAVATPLMAGFGSRLFGANGTITGIVLSANAMILALLVAELVRAVWTIALFRKAA